MNQLFTPKRFRSQLCLISFDNMTQRRKDREFEDIHEERTDWMETRFFCALELFAEATWTFHEVIETYGNLTEIKTSGDQSLGFSVQLWADISMMMILFYIHFIERIIYGWCQRETLCNALCPMEALQYYVLEIELDLFNLMVVNDDVDIVDDDDDDDDDGIDDDEF
ncbi:hypothetical protein C0J52_22819 [Blattella germanica]|nr:hypothetical protein C0J52_22819 [Blattella germanica]